jgi:hypothetical protein
VHLPFLLELDILRHVTHFADMERHTMTNQLDDPFHPARFVCGRYNIVGRTLSRWEGDEKLGFPKPTVIRNRRYWREAELVAWERSPASKVRAAD